MESGLASVLAQDRSKSTPRDEMMNRLACIREEEQALAGSMGYSGLSVARERQTRGDI